MNEDEMKIDTESRQHLFYLYLDGDYTGPFNMHEIEKLCKINKVSYDSMIWDCQTETWRKLNLQFEDISDKIQSNKSEPLDFDAELFEAEMKLKQLQLNKMFTSDELNGTWRGFHLSRKRVHFIFIFAVGLMSSIYLTLKFNQFYQFMLIDRMEVSTIAKDKIKQILKLNSQNNIQVFSDQINGSMQQLIFSRSSDDDLKLNLELSAIRNTVATNTAVNINKSIILTERVKIYKIEDLFSLDLLPTGEYNLVVRDIENRVLNSGIKLTIGSLNDQYYLQLKGYHELIKVQSKEEIIELTQFIETFEKLISDQLDMLQQSSIEGSIKKLKTYFKENDQFINKLNIEFEKMSSRKNTYFYQTYYTSLFAINNEFNHLFIQLQNLSQSQNLSKLEKNLILNNLDLLEKTKSLKLKLYKLSLDPYDEKGLPRVL